MQKLMKHLHKNEKGFTLVELMVVVVIIGVLVAIAIPIFGTVQTNAADRAHEANVRILQGAGNMYIAEHGVPTAALTVGTELDAFIDGTLLGLLVPDRASAANSPGSQYVVTIGTDGVVSVTTVAASGS